jgi:hypothetical protein
MKKSYWMIMVEKDLYQDKKNNIIKNIKIYKYLISKIRNLLQKDPRIIDPCIYKNKNFLSGKNL